MAVGNGRLFILYVSDICNASMSTGKIPRVPGVLGAREKASYTLCNLETCTPHARIIICGPRAQKNCTEYRPS